MRLLDDAQIKGRLARAAEIKQENTLAFRHPPQCHGIVWLRGRGICRRQEGKNTCGKAQGQQNMA
ncbi:hypothetical protein [Zoogloea sp.]|uniref:hypothetical protein n=1 Tax=Zoogloea sp. TaxID=49181 RepID=UPI0025EC45E8|nr:hypothetical protein [Zoogloea sp.]MCK6392315.1 hypothetical protein [Zoogloea sp.]